jgi:hypothetical protein
MENQGLVYHSGVVCGIWKFRLPPEELVKLAQEWKSSPKGENYTYLHVRQCSRDQFGIEFLYHHGKGGDCNWYYKQYFAEMTDMLKRRFGNDFAGWDVTDSIHIVK